MLVVVRIIFALSFLALKSIIIMNKKPPHSSDLTPGDPHKTSEESQPDKFSTEPDYVPVSCDFVDLIEHHTTLRTPLKISYLQDGLAVTASGQVVQTWENKGGVEYVLLTSGLRIRMDHIIELAGKKPDGDCKL